MQERNDTDRRCSRTGSRFPLRNSKGELVRRERRKQQDRRLAAGIEMEWMEIASAAGYTK